MLVKVKRISRAFARGPRTHIGIITTKRPVMWIIRTMPSIKGSLVAKEVLKIIEKLITAIAKSVPCQALNSYFSSFRTIKP